MSANQTNPGKVIVISGPSGAGKTTLVRQVFDHFPRLVSSISATTRPPRPGEEHGVDYYFLSAEEFLRRRAEGDFLESCEVFGRGYWYGTLLEEVEPSLRAGKSVLLEIDVEGTRTVLDRFPQAVTIFMGPSRPEELERRLRSRATESEEAILRRLEVARREMAQTGKYQYLVINDTVPEAVEQLSTILSQAGVGR